MARLLLVTCGVTDLRAVVETDGHEALALFANNTQRAVHEKLLDSEIASTIDPGAAGLPQLDYTHLSLGDQGLEIVRGADGPAEAGAPLPEGPLRLVPMKLAGIDTVFRDRRPDTILVLNTRRTTRRAEPIAAGPLLAGWLAESFGLDLVTGAAAFGARTCACLDYIDDDVPADGPGGESVNPLAIQRIDDALGRIMEPVTTVTFALSGGMPAYRDQVRELARFRFPDAHLRDCIRPSDPERGVITARTPSLTPADSMRIRREARRLVNEGDFSGAAALGRQMRDQESERSWIAELEAAALYFEGRLPPLADIPAYMKKLTGAGAPRALLPALRTEAGLRAGHIPEAVLWTCAFAEAAMVDQIAQLSFVESVDELTAKLCVVEGHKLDRSLTEEDERNNKLLSKRGRQLYFFWVHTRWMEYFPEPAASALSTIHEALLTETDRGVTLRDVRNRLAHGAVPLGNMTWLVEGFEKAGLWRTRTDEGPRFLGNEQVRSLCEAAGSRAPSTLYNELVGGLLNTLDTHRYG